MLPELRICLKNQGFNDHRIFLDGCFPPSNLLSDLFIDGTRDSWMDTYMLPEIRMRFRNQIWNFEGGENLLDGLFLHAIFWQIALHLVPNLRNATRKIRNALHAIFCK